MTATKAHCRSGACYDRLFCMLPRDLLEKTTFWKQTKRHCVWSWPNLVSLWPAHFTLQRNLGNIFILREKCQITHYTQIPQKSGVLFNHCKFKSLYDFLKLAIPDSQDDADLLSVLPSIQSRKPFSGCLCIFCWRQYSPERNIARHCSSA